MPIDEFVSEDEYLIGEPQAEYKSEFRDGRIIAMSGGSPPHALITAAVIMEIGVQLKGRPCRVYSSDTRIKVASARFYTYPDLSVACGKPVFDSRDEWALVNPTLIVEVLSPSTEKYDRGEKFGYYKKLDSLREYLLVAQDRVWVELFSRQEDGEWKGAVFTSRDDVIELPAIGCRVSVKDLYDKVEF